LHEHEYRLMVASRSVSCRFRGAVRDVPDDLRPIQPAAVLHGDYETFGDCQQLLICKRISKVHPQDAGRFQNSFDLLEYLDEMGDILLRRILPTQRNGLGSAFETSQCLLLVW